MSLGYARTLEATDLWKLQDHRSSAVISEKILGSFAARRTVADEWNARLDQGMINPGFGKKTWWNLTGKWEEKEKAWREGQRKSASLTWAMNDSIKSWFWWAVVFRLLGDMANALTPLLVKVRNFLCL